MLTALGAFNCWRNCYCWVKRNGGRMIVKGAQGAELLGFNKSPETYIYTYYTHLNHFTVILLMANFKLLPHGRRRKITTTCCCGFSSIFRVLRGACPTLLYDSYCSAENHSYIYSSLQFALFFGPGPKSIRLIHYLLNFSVSRPKNFHFIN